MPCRGDFHFAFLIHFSPVLIFAQSLSTIWYWLLSSVFSLRMNFRRIWWMTSARSSSWRWATWMEARSMEPEAGGACLLGAVVSPLLGHTGKGIDAHTVQGKDVFSFIQPLKLWYLFTFSKFLSHYEVNEEGLFFFFYSLDLIDSMYYYIISLTQTICVTWSPLVVFGSIHNPCISI